MQQQSMFGGQWSGANADRIAPGDPLASRMRPRSLDEFVGQQHLLGPGMVLRQMIESDAVGSMIFWGPPGVGKTTLARIIARRTNARFVDFSAVTSGIKEIKAVMAEAEDSRMMGLKTILFVDEIHRFNRAQQDAFLPYVERGAITLIGATTENPSFEINAALLSRCKVFVLNPLAPADMVEMLHRTLTDSRGFGGQIIEISDDMLYMIGNFANGDMRMALNTLEMVVLNGRRLPVEADAKPLRPVEQADAADTPAKAEDADAPAAAKNKKKSKKNAAAKPGSTKMGDLPSDTPAGTIQQDPATQADGGPAAHDGSPAPSDTAPEQAVTPAPTIKTVVTMDILEQVTAKKALLYDKDREEHYNIISALHKSMRNSDPQAAIYWLARMLEAGEDPLYVARRVVRFASEDIGMADSSALQVAVAAYQACHFLGMPECNVHLTHAVTYCALAPKSNALYRAYEHAKTDALHTMAEPVPLVIRNAVTKLMGDLHYGEGYQYAHATEEKLTAMQCLPDALADRQYYEPTTQGREARVKEWMEKLAATRAEIARRDKPEE